MMNHVNSQIKNRRRNTVIARGKIINIEHNEDYSYLKLFIRNGAGLRHTYADLWRVLVALSIRRLGPPTARLMSPAASTFFSRAIT